MQNVHRILLTFGFLSAGIFSTQTTLAQQALATKQQPPILTPQPASQTPAPSVTPPGGVFVVAINTQTFGEKILEVRQELENIDRDFKPTTDSLAKAASEIRSEEGALRETVERLEPPVRQKRIEALDAKKKDFMRRQEDFNETFKRRLGIVITPIQERIAKAMEEYAKERNILLMIDTAAVSQNNSFLYISPVLDVTEDFIKRYNQSHPVKK